MDSIKEAFRRVKEDVDALSSELNLLKNNISQIDPKFDIILEEIKSLKKVPPFNFGELSVTPLPFGIPSTDTISDSTFPTHSSTDKPSFKPLKPPNTGISTGNEGVPTDRQTNQQTDRHIEKEEKIVENALRNSIHDAVQILNSLDSLKKEIRLKFKRLTEQEFLVFSTLYQLDDEKGFADYKTLAQKLSLTQSSIRDYIGRIISKGIPIDKLKINNKSIQLKISSSLRKIVSLPTIIQLRDI